MADRVTTAEAAAMLGCHPSTLREMAARAPGSLPGTPIRIGTGARTHLRWDPELVEAWQRAYQAWVAVNTKNAKGAALAPRRSTRAKTNTTGRKPSLLSQVR